MFRKEIVASILVLILLNLMYIELNNDNNLLVRTTLTASSSSFSLEENKRLIHENSGPFEFMIPEHSFSEYPILPKVSAHNPGYQPSKMTTGNIHVAVLLIEFSDLKANTSPTYFSNLLFNYQDPKSLANYYYENSYGRVNITGEIIGNKWYQSSGTSIYWGDDLGAVFPNVDNKKDYIYNLVREGILIADSQTNFSKFDSNGDDIIDHLLIVHAGDAQESTGTVTDIWSHRWSVLQKTIVDNVTVKDYTMCAETSPLGTFAHELGHDIGNLPDLYDTDYSSDGIGQWGVMGAGAWNYNSSAGEKPGATPVHFCAFSKIKMGWITPKIVTKDTASITLPSYENTASESVLKLFLSDQLTSVTLNEYYLITYRSQVGFDSTLPGEGILIWHIDECAKENENQNERRKLVDLEEADATFDPGLVWEQLDYYSSTPPGATLPDDAGSTTDCWLVGSSFNDSSIPNSESNGGVVTNIGINVTASNILSIHVSHDPLPWDYTQYLLNASHPSYIDDESSIIEHQTYQYGPSRAFSVVFQSNRSGILDIFGSQTLDGGKTWKNTSHIVSGLKTKDFSPTLILAAPPKYWTGIYDRDFPSAYNLGPSLITEPPPHYIVAYVSNGTGNLEIYVTLSEDFYTWTHPTRITDDSSSDLDPCLITTPEGVGLFWASNRSGNYEIYYKEDIWKETIVQITTNGYYHREPSYILSRNNTHYLAFEENSGGYSTIQLMRTTNISAWPSNSVTVTNPSSVSIEPSIIQHSDGNLIIAFTHQTASQEEIHLAVSADGQQWSEPLKMGFVKNASSPALAEGACHALFLAYTMYNSSQIQHVYVIHSTYCYTSGIGIRFPVDTGSSFFNPQRAEIGSDWVYSGNMTLNQSDYNIVDDSVRINVTTTNNTWYESDDGVVLENWVLDPIADPALAEYLKLDTLRGIGNFSIPLALFPLDWNLYLQQIVRIDISWGYFREDMSRGAESASFFLEMVPVTDHLVVEGDITFENPIISRNPIIKGLIAYGVESISLQLFDTLNTPDPTDDILYSLETLLLTDIAKDRGFWQSRIPKLRKNMLTKVVATSNGIYPRKQIQFYINFDTIAPVVTILTPQNGSTIDLRTETIEFQYIIEETANYAVNIFLNGTSIGMKVNGSFITEITTAGNYILAIEVIDTAGNIGRHEILIKVIISSETTSDSTLSEATSSTTEISTTKATRFTMELLMFYVVIFYYFKRKSVRNGQK